MILSNDGSPHKVSQSGHGGDRKINTSASHRDHDGGGGAALRDGSAVKNGSLTQIVDRGTTSLLKTELIPESHGMFNSSDIRASLLRTQGEPVR